VIYLLASTDIDNSGPIPPLHAYADGEPTTLCGLDLDDLYPLGLWFPANANTCRQCAALTPAVWDLESNHARVRAHPLE
jgi:hypothetical protein